MINLSLFEFNELKINNYHVLNLLKINYYYYFIYKSFLNYNILQIVDFLQNKLIDFDQLV